MKTRRGTLWVFVAMLSAPSANAMMIDAFDFTQGLIANADKPSDVDVMTDPSILGGQRETDLLWTSGLGDVQLLTNADCAGLLDFNIDANTQGEVEIIWDGPVDNPSGLVDYMGLGAIDLTEQGNSDRIRIDVVSNDLPVDLLLMIYSDKNNWSWASATVAGGITANTSYDFPFGSFSPILAGAADFTKIGAIRLAVGRQLSGGALQIDSIATSTPEPTTLSLMVLGSLMLLCRRRRIGIPRQLA